MFIRVPGLVCFGFLSSLSPSFAASCIVNDTDIAQTYDGPCVDGKAHGRGKASGRDRYEGDFIAGNKHGQGHYIWGVGSSIPGSSYIGAYANDRANGQGIYKWPPRADQAMAVYFKGLVRNGERVSGEFIFRNKDRYVGEIQNNLFHGKGVLTAPNGYRYEGTFVNHKRSGSGRAKFANGDHYEGQWLNGSEHGQGVWTRGSNRACPPPAPNQLCHERIDGQWREGKFVNGKMYFAGGDSHTGNVIYKPDGTMKLTNLTAKGVGAEVNLLDTMKALGGLMGGLARAVPPSEAGSGAGRRGTASLYCSQKKSFDPVQGSHVRNVLTVDCTGDGQTCVDSARRSIDAKYISVKGACEKLVGYDWWPDIRANR